MTFIRTLSIVATFICLSSNAALAQGLVRPTPTPRARAPINCVVPKVDGERVPFPLAKANTKFELSENETYLLEGTLVMLEGRSFFKVDFKSQPYLATEKLKQFPYFAVDVDATTVERAQGSLVQLAVIARKTTLQGVFNGRDIKLQAILPPQIL